MGAGVGDGGFGGGAGYDVDGGADLGGGFGGGSGYDVDGGADLGGGDGGDDRAEVDRNESGGPVAEDSGERDLAADDDVGEAELEADLGATSC